MSSKSVLIAAGIILIGLLGGLIANYPRTALAGSGLEASAPFSLTNQQEATVDSRLVTANTNFGFKLFSKLFHTSGQQNIFISPTSVAIALNMLYNGASGETQQAMAKALELQGMSLQELNQDNKALKETLLNPEPEVQLTIANSLWAEQGVIFRPEFLQKNQQFYQAKITNLDFASPVAADEINEWVKQSTHSKITRIIDKIKPNEVLFLLNAIYFKGNWTTRFNRNQTVSQPFHLLDGTIKQQSMMSQSGRYRYYENDQLQAVSLPYGKERLSLYLFLPKQNSSLKTFSQQLNTENWEQWMDQFSKRQGSIQIPRFKSDYGVELNDTLKALGMSRAFDPTRADFTAMTSTPVTISQVKHKTFVEVNEEGTEAAAATSVGIARTSAYLPQQPFRMVVDHPFFCAIRDNQTKTVLFIGSIVNPGG